MTHANTGEGQTHPELTTLPDVQRLHYLDNVRALAMFLGVIFHAALAYSPLMHNLWFTTGEQSSATIDFVNFFTHLFRMPLFFLISGFFALMLIEKRGLSGFVKNRMKRIVLPFVVFFPLVVMGVFAAVGWALGNVENLSPLMQFIKMMQANPDAPQPPPSPMHLWFLINLFFFIVTAALLYKLKFFQSRLLEKMTSAKFVVLVLPLLMVPALVTQVAPHPAPEKFYPQLWSFGFYGLFFLLGSAFFLKQNVLDELDRYKHGLLAVALVGYGYFYSMLPATIDFKDALAMAEGVSFDWAHLPVAIVEAYVAVFMTLYCLLMGRSLLNKQNAALRLVSDSSYWVYLMHLPVLLAIQFSMADGDMNMWLQFVISCLGTFAICLLSYVVLVKRTPIGWLLNGRKKAKSQEQQKSAGALNIQD
ncbi:MAG: acyltransferase family protein [Algicola sp.]|nr:acyltransferase family protein [Algicola sp.]